MHGMATAIDIVSKCLECGSSFTPSRGWQKFCIDKGPRKTICSERYWNKNRASTLERIPNPTGITKADLAITPRVAQTVIYLRVDGDPVATERPRSGNNGIFYTPKKTREYQEELGWTIKAELPVDHDIQGTFGVLARFYRSTRRKIDVDNLLKTILDSCTKAKVWDDDCQVRELIGQLWIGHHDPRTEFVVYRMTDPSPLPTCTQCGKLLKAYSKKTKTSYCSKVCHVASQAEATA
jgi:Holliday junction resolvase RusA-like endonuclease